MEEEERVVSGRMPLVLAVDHDDRVLRDWSAWLAADARLVSAPSLESARRRTEPEVWEAEPCDYVLLELGLPDGDGAELVARFEALQPRPLIAVLSTCLDAPRALALWSRCALVLPKPLDADTLRRALKALKEVRSGGSVLARFAARHRLGRQETKLLHAAAIRGVTNDEAADLLGCAPATVRSHWRRIAEKVGCHGQRDIMVSLLSFTLGQPHRGLS